MGFWQRNTQKQLVSKAKTYIKVFPRQIFSNYRIINNDNKRIKHRKTIKRNFQKKVSTREQKNKGSNLATDEQMFSSRHFI